MRKLLCFLIGITLFAAFTPVNAQSGNTPPIIDSPLVIDVADVYKNYTLTFTVIDDDLPVTFSLQNAPNGATIDPETGVFSWNPTFPDRGIHNFEIIVTDSGTPTASSTAYVELLVVDIGTEFSFETQGDFASADYDDDGDFDLLIRDRVNDVWGLRLYRNDGSFGFSYHQTITTGSNIHNPDWIDYDTDGDLDVFAWTDGGNIIYENQGAMSFTPVTLPFDVIDYFPELWGDYDNDGDLDIVIQNYDGTTYSTEIYSNDGGIFTNANVTFPDNLLPLKWNDYDDDGDLDLIGLTDIGVEHTEIALAFYRNDGSDTYTRILTNLSRFAYLPKLGDYDNDGDLDFMGAFLDQAGVNYQIEIYRNDGSLTFTYVNTLSNLGWEYHWLDFDNDGDLDIALISSRKNNPAELLGTIYLNNSSSFVSSDYLYSDPVQDTNYWVDFDDDHDLDAFSFPYYVNFFDDSEWLEREFTVVNNSEENTPPSEPTGLTVTPILTNGVQLSWQPSTDLETPTAGLTYNLRVGTTPDGVNISSPMSNVTNGDRWILAPGNLGNGTTTVLKNLEPGTYYWSVQAVDSGYRGSPFAAEGMFTIEPNTEPYFALEQLEARVDVDETYTYTPEAFDDDQPAQTLTFSLQNAPTGASIDPITGEFTWTPTITDTGVYTFDIVVTDDGIPALSAQSPVSLTVLDIGNRYDILTSGIFATADLDHDGDLDYVKGAGFNPFGDPENGDLEIYLNDGQGHLSYYADIAQDVFYTGYVGCIDYDNDGDLDIVTDNHFIYRNEGSNQFTSISVPFSLYHHDAWGDYDQDGDLDVISSVYIDPVWQTKIYRNDAGVFTETNIVLPNGTDPIGWFDYDNDGDLDFYLYDTNNLEIYLNDGQGQFIGIPTNLPVSLISVQWRDFDYDGDLDLIGANEDDNLTEVYQNEGNGVFSPSILLNELSQINNLLDFDNDGDLDISVLDHGQSSVYLNSGGTFTLDQIAWGTFPNDYNYWVDFDNDHDLDAYVTSDYHQGTGTDNTFTVLNPASPNTPPGAPSGLSVNPLNSNSVQLSWQPSTDLETPAAGLTYNLRVGTTPNGVNISSPMSNVITGDRWILAPGNLGNGTTTILKNLEPGTYYWSVQAVDSGYRGSPFAAEGMFTIEAVIPTSTFTSIPPTETSTGVPATSTNTPVPPTETSTTLPVTSTFTSIPPTETATSEPTFTSVPPTATSTDVPVEILGNGGFELVENGSLTRWKANGLGTLDGRVCNRVNRPGKPDKIVAHSGNCAFKFTGTSAKYASISQKIVVTDAIDQLHLSAWVNSKKAQAGVVVMVRVIYTDTSREKLKLLLPAGTSAVYTELVNELTVTKAVNKLKVQVRYWGNIGRIFIDDVSLTR